jgi:hypothetical protein
MTVKKPRTGQVYGSQREMLNAGGGGGGAGFRIRKLFGTPKGKQGKAHSRTKGMTVGDYYKSKGLQKDGSTKRNDSGQSKRTRGHTEDMFRSATTPRKR